MIEMYRVFVASGERGSTLDSRVGDGYRRLLVWLRPDGEAYNAFYPPALVNTSIPRLRWAGMRATPIPTVDLNLPSLLASAIERRDQFLKLGVTFDRDVTETAISRLRSTINGAAVVARTRVRPTIVASVPAVVEVRSGQSVSSDGPGPVAQVGVRQEGGGVCTGEQPRARARHREQRPSVG